MVPILFLFQSLLRFDLHFILTGTELRIAIFTDFPFTFLHNLISGWWEAAQSRYFPSGCCSQQFFLTDNPWKLPGSSTVNKT